MCNTGIKSRGIQLPETQHGDSTVVPDLKQDSLAAPTRPRAPASGCFGYTRAHLVAPRSCTMEAELFARFYVEPVTPVPPKSR